MMTRRWTLTLQRWKSCQAVVDDKEEDELLDDEPLLLLLEGEDDEDDADGSCYSSCWNCCDCH